MAVMIDASQCQVLLRGCHGIEVLHCLPCCKLRSGKGATCISGGQSLLSLDRVGGRVKQSSWMLVIVEMSLRRGRS